MIFSAASALPSDFRIMLDDLVERVEDLLEALEEVDALPERGELVLQPLGDDFEAEVQEVPQDLLQIEPLGPADFRILGRESGRSG